MFSPTANLSLTLNRSLGKGWNAFISADNLIQLKSVIITEEEGFYRKSRAKNYATCSLTISYAFSSGKKFKQRKIENNLDSERLQRE